MVELNLKSKTKKKSLDNDQAVQGLFIIQDLRITKGFAQTLP